MEKEKITPEINLFLNYEGVPVHIKLPAKDNFEDSMKYARNCIVTAKSLGFEPDSRNGKSKVTSFEPEKKPCPVHPGEMLEKKIGKTGRPYFGHFINGSMCFGK